MVLLLVAPAAVALLYYAWLLSYWARRGVKAQVAAPSLDFLKPPSRRRRCLARRQQRLYDAFEGESAYGRFSFASPVLVLRDLDLAKRVVLRDCGLFSARNSRVLVAFCPLVRGGLYNSCGARWKALRFALAPVFCSAARSGAILELAEGPCRRLRASLEGGPAPARVDALTRAFSADLLAAAVFGLAPEGLEEFTLHAEVLADHFRVTDGCSSPLVACAAQLFHPYDVGAAERFFLAAVGGATDPRSFVGRLLEGGGSVGWVNVQACSFVVLGLRPMALLLTAALVELARNPRVQDRLRQELRATEDLQGGDYLDRVVAETLRKWPPVLELVRETTQACALPGTSLQLEARTKVTVPVFAIHRDPHHFPDPERFDPDRFNDDDNLRRHSCCYLPFGDGPRNCLGMRFAVLSAKACLATILKDLEFQTCDDAKTKVLDPFSYPEGKSARLRVRAVP